MQQKFKILLSVHACSPNHGSEPGMGWNFVRALSKIHELHVITEEVKWKADLERQLLHDPVLKENIKFYYIKKKRNSFLRKIWPPSYYYFYKTWQKEAFRLAKKLDKIEDFDIIHQLNMVGFREPGYLWKINKPFVWGPIGGLEDVRFKLLLNVGLNSFIYYTLRKIINLWQKKFKIRPKKAAKRRNSFLIAATSGDKNLISKYWKRSSEIIPEVGQEILSLKNIKTRSDNEPLIIVWSGQHTSGKALNILLKSLRHIPKEINWQLSILGSGKLSREWQLLAKKYKIDSRCSWYKWLSKSDAHLIMQKSHVLCITSLKDLTSTVTLEGLSFGLPIICIDHCGFGNVVNEDCGIKIPVDYPIKLILGFRNALETLYFNEPLRQSLAWGALKRASDFCWEEKVNHLNKIYNSLLNKEL